MKNAPSRWILFSVSAPSSPIPASSIGFSDTWRVRRAAPGTRSSRARHRRPAAIPCHEFQRRPLEHSANLDPKTSDAPCVSQWGAQCRTNPLGRENISEERFLEPAFRPAKPGLIAQQGCHLRWPLETFRCVRDRMSYSSLGLQLVCTLADQLRAELRVERGAGTAVHLEFDGDA